MVVPLTKELINRYLNEMIEMSSQLHGDYWAAEHYLSELNKKWDLSFALMEKNEMLGFMIVSDKDVSYHLHRIVIRKEQIGKGYGKILLERLINDAKTALKNAVTLKVHPANDVAINLYEKYGFKKVATDGENYSYRLDLAI